jgi:ribosome-binding factor A
MSRRTERVNFTLKRELGALIENEISDPRLAPVTSVTRVECAADLSVARVYISTLGSEAAQSSSLEALKSASGYLRRALAGRLRMRHVPRIEFRADDALREGARLLKVIDEVAESDRQAAEGRGGQ